MSGMIAWSRVNELREEIGKEDFDEVVTLFLREVEEVIGRLRDAPEIERMEADLHFVRGSALNLGFRSLAELCDLGERQCAAGAANEVRLEEIIGAYERSKTRFQSEMPRFLGS